MHFSRCNSPALLTTAILLTLTSGCAARPHTTPEPFHAALTAHTENLTADVTMKNAVPANSGKIGVDLDSPTGGSRTRAFVDLGAVCRPFTTLDGKGDAPTDASGWPQTDGQVVFFDIRAVPAWVPPIDDPARFQPDWSGTYHLAFTGQATIKPADISQFTLVHQAYDAGANVTTVDIVVPSGTGLLAVTFTQTKRTPDSPVNSGITGLHLIRPGYPANTRQVFTNSFLNALRPFGTLRFMDWLNTNGNPGFYGDPGHHALNWAGRHVPSDATQEDQGTKHGVAYEYAIALCNQTGKDMWINVPIAATDDYVRSLAILLKKTLNPSLHIYVEDSNEVWNFGFPQYIYNKLAAVDEVGKGGSTLNNDGTTDQETWAHRRHAKRLVEISNIFKEVYGVGAINTTVRPVYASWIISPSPHFDDVLQWVDKTYGPPKSYFYALADAAYYNAQKAAPTATPQEIVAAMRADSDNNRAARIALQTIATKYGLKHFQYEVGSDTGGGSTVNVANRILANRDPSIKDVMIHDYRENWQPIGGDLYMYFSLCSPYSRYGGWGLSEDITDLHTPKRQAIDELTMPQP